MTNLKELPFDTIDSDKPQANFYLKPKTNKSKSKLNKSLMGDFGKNALQNWYSNMSIRKKLQKHIASGWYTFLEFTLNN